MDEGPKGFAELFEAEAPVARVRPLEVGDEVEGTVVHAGKDEVFVELDAKRQAYFETLELLRPDGSLSVAVGDVVRGFVTAAEGDGPIRLGRGFGRDAGRAELEVALAQQIPIEGTVTGVNKGGLEVLALGQRAFCPKSQVDDRFVEDLAPYVGQTLEFLVTGASDRDVVLSRRRHLEARSRRARDELAATVTPGAILTGRVKELRSFGAFVDLGGIDGLIPSRELTHERGRPVGELVSVGDTVEVKVLEIESTGDRLRVTLSLKALSSDPWDGIEHVAPVGRVVAGQVTRRAEFGLFVRLAPAVEGLLHVSELGAEGTDTYEVGSPILAVVKSVDPSQRRISLAIAQDGAEAGSVSASRTPVVGSVVRATVEKVERFGLFVQVADVKGRAGRGLIPSAELGVDRGVDLRKEFPPGREVRAKVLETGEGKLRLSVRAAADDAERAEYDGYRDQHAPPARLGTLGDLLRRKG